MNRLKRTNQGRPEQAAMERSTRPLAKKLAIKEGQKLLLLSAPPGYSRSLGQLPKGVTMTAGRADVVQVFATTRKELKDLVAKAKSSMNPGGMIWITYPKGGSKVKSEINRDSIREHAMTVGLETVALVAIDDDWSAIRCKAG
jgi:hypothetical protein